MDTHTHKNTLVHKIIYHFGNMYLVKSSSVKRITQVIMSTLFIRVPVYCKWSSLNVKREGLLSCSFFKKKKDKTLYYLEIH